MSNFDKDSLNAFSGSFELRIYYNDHTFCSDYAFANFKSNAELQKKLVKLLTTPELKKNQADIKGFSLQQQLGFKPHGLQGLLIEKIYSTYKLADIQKGYPSKQERIVIAKKCKIQQHNSMNILKKRFICIRKQTI